MAATIYYFSTNARGGDQSAAYTVAGTGASGSLNQGTTTTDFPQTSDYFMFSVKVDTNNDGSHPTSGTKAEADLFLEKAKRWVHAMIGGSTNIGPGTGRGEGLDYCIKANNGTQGVP
jgi:hypothetical protein